MVADGLYNTATKFDLHYTYANGVKLRVSSNRPASASSAPGSL
jgi:hypothetical protein